MASSPSLGNKTPDAADSYKRIKALEQPSNFAHDRDVIAIRTNGKARGAAVVAWSGLAAFLVMAPAVSVRAGNDPATNAGSAFPNVNEVFQGQSFESKFDQEVFFLRRIREDYPVHWPDLLAANITPDKYADAPEKLEHFVRELSAVTAKTDDPVACTSLASLISDPDFYANTNAYHPDILTDAILGLLILGPAGHRALADAFNQEHYRKDSASLELLADTIASTHVDDPVFAAALAAGVFTFTTASGGFFSHCTTDLTSNLLRFPDGVVAVEKHLGTNEILNAPGRFQSVMEGFSGSNAIPLVTNLTAISNLIVGRLDTLTNKPGPYRDELKQLQSSVGQALQRLR